MRTLRNVPLQPRRDAWVEVNLGAIEENAKAIRQRIPRHVALMAIVKADAYGHGATMVLPILEASGVGMAGVASMDEAIHLRQAGIKMPVLVIGVVPDWAFQYATDYDIQLTIFAHHHLESLRKAYVQDRTPFKVHIKVDTGMHRIGIPWDEAADFVQLCQSLPYVEVEGVFSHLADSHDTAMSEVQLSRWAAVCAQINPLPRYVHISNSGHALAPSAFGSERQMETPNTLARLGIGFFGYGKHPLAEPLALKPVMSLKARIMHLQSVPPNTGISYGHLYHTPLDSERLIATVPLGYADGVPRCLSSQIHGFLGGHQVHQVGNITMDQMMFDVSDVNGVAIGDTITLLGMEDSKKPECSIWLDDWAKKANTIEYELMCGLRVRLPKTYTR
jgi:alanine racemase